MMTSAYVTILLLFHSMVIVPSKAAIKNMIKYPMNNPKLMNASMRHGEYALT